MYKTFRVCEFLHRRKDSVPIIPDKEYNLVTVKLHHKGVVLREKKRGSELGSTMFRIRKGQFILSGIDARNGAFGIVPDELDGAIITNDFWTFDVDETVVKRDFFYWLTNTPLFLDACIKSSKGETQRIRLQKDLFFNFEFHLPPVNEQTTFLRRIETADSAIVRLNQELEKQSGSLTKLRQAILQEAIEGKLTAGWRKQNPHLITGENHASKLLEKIRAEKARLIKDGKIRKEKPLPPITDAEKPFPLPEGWVWCRLGEVSEAIFDGPFGSHLKTADYTDSGVQVIRLENIGAMKFKNEKTAFVSEEKYKTLIQHTIYEGDVIVGSFIADGVKCVLIPKLKYRAIAKADCFCVRTRSLFVQRQFIVLALTSSSLFPQLADAMHGMTRQRINTTQLKKMQVPVPPFSEQQVIVERVGSLLATVDQLERHVSDRKQQSELLMQSVLKEAFEQSH